MIIAAISDTHITGRARALPVPLVERLRTVDLILHAGDIATADALREIELLAPTRAVRGNVDDSSLRSILPASRTIQAASFRIGLVHGDSGQGLTTLQRARRAFQGVDCIVFGHSHSPYVGIEDGVLMVNPGSPTDKRREPRPSYALITVEDRISAEIVYL